MAIEKERKFLVKDNHVPSEISARCKAGRLLQGYLMLGGKQQLRIRTVDDKEAFICFKSDIALGEKHEFEYPVPLKDAHEMLALAQYKIVKDRYSYSVARTTFDIDVYPDFNLVICEIEYDDGDKIEIPGYCAEEITGVKEYSNIYLAMKLSGKSS